MAKIPSDEELIQMMSDLSNWGRWGEGDQLGCLNLITPDKIIAATKLVTDGHTVSCARPITCLLYTSPSPRDRQKSRMPSSA